MISIIIPTLNEEANVRVLLQYLRELDVTAEIVVADGGSSDGTVEAAAEYAVTVESERGRGTQMNAGAAVARGDVLWFVHADCLPHPDSIKALERALTDETVAGGGFTYSLSCSGFRFRLAESLSNWKNRAFKFLYGDMGIFVRRSVFKNMNGYAEIPLMEDMDFSRRLKRQGRIVVLPLTMRTSGRRWMEEGWLYCSLRSWTLQALWRLGVSPATLSRWYRFG